MRPRKSSVVMNAVEEESHTGSHGKEETRRLTQFNLLAPPSRSPLSPPLVPRSARLSPPLPGAAFSCAPGKRPQSAPLPIEAPPFRPGRFLGKIVTFERGSLQLETAAMLSAGVAPRLLALFPLLSAVCGDCPPPPILKNAVFLNDPGTSFPEGKIVIYQCLSEFYNIRRKIDATQCFRSAWTHVEDFCESSCPDAPRFRFAQVNKTQVQTYYVPANTLSYNCRAAYDRIPGMSSIITCLPTYNWTELPVFCKRKSCGVPGNPQNGRTVIQTNLLYFSKVNFICDDGYRLIGSPSTQCKLKGTEVKWDKELPNCEPITCMSPPNITSGTHNGTNGTFAYHTAITYKCDDDFSLIGEASLSCITENHINGVWNGPGPECRRNPTPQDSTVATTTVTISVPFTRREMERGSTSSGTTYNNTPISRIEKKGSRIWMVAGVSVSSVAVIAAVVAAIRASSKVRQKKRSSYNLNQGSKNVQHPQTSWAEV